MIGQDISGRRRARTSFNLGPAEHGASILPPDRLLKYLRFFRMNHLHIMGFVGPHAVAEVEIERLASLRPSRKLIISASSLLPLFITIGSDFSTIVSIDRVSGQHADQSKCLTDAEMCICSGGRRTGIGSSTYRYPHLKYFTGGKNDQVVLPWTAC